MGQVTLFLLFIIALIVGAFAYFLPEQQAVSPFKVVMVNGDYETTEQTNTKKSQQLNMTTDRGIVQIHRQIDDLTREQKKLIGMVDYDQQVLNNTNKEISEITKQVNGKSGIDVLKLKALGRQLQNDQRLLVEHGMQLIALNDQLNKNRKLLAEERDLVNINSESYLQLLQEHNSLLKDQFAIFFDKVTRQSNNFLQHTQDLIEEDRQKVQDQQNR